MTHRALYKVVFCFIAIMLVCFCLQPTALAAIQLANDNHTDTADYCLRAHDVTIGLSEFVSMTRAELESEIISKSGFVFKIRDSAPSSNDWILVTSGYTADFSALQEAETAIGYPVVVTLPVITPGLLSQITFRVFVVDDSPPVYQVSYQFTGASSTRSLPDEVLALLPSHTTAVAGTIITPQSTFSTVRGHAGYWQFTGWNTPSQTINDHDIVFVGAWEWITLHYSTPTPTVEPSPTPTIYLDVETTSAPVLTPISNTPNWAIQIISNDDDTDNSDSHNDAVKNKATGNTGSEIGDFVKMVIALALTSIVSIQVVGIASDLRVLKWYKAKKAKARGLK